MPKVLYMSWKVVFVWEKSRTTVVLMVWFVWSLFILNANHVCIESYHHAIGLINDLRNSSCMGEKKRY